MGHVGRPVPRTHAHTTIVVADLELQKSITRAALNVLGDRGFVLAGSGAIREHGMIDRPTEDIDLFTSRNDPAAFAESVNTLIVALRGIGYTVEQIRTAQTYARLEVRHGDDALHVDLGVDWRKDPPTRLAIGPTLSLDDAVGSKVAALYSRAEARDFLDVDRIRRSGRYTDAELLAEAAQRDPGFDVDMFRRELANIRRLRPDDVRVYGVSADHLEEIRVRYRTWADEIEQGRVVPGPEAQSGCWVELDSTTAPDPNEMTYYTTDTDPFGAAYGVRKDDPMVE